MDIKKANSNTNININNNFKTSEININNMYKNHSGIDFDKVYSDYNYVSSRTN